ncbi:MAG: hypothetical protein IIT94_07085 [Prevotella sp.]|nr:hypothetical protein [Prevotella sp.]
MITLTTGICWRLFRFVGILQGCGFVKHRVLGSGVLVQRITVFSMQPMQGGRFQQEILGYSLMNAMGIKAEEIR